MTEDREEEQNDGTSPETEEEKEEVVWELPDIDEEERAEIIEQSREAEENDRGHRAGEKVEKDLEELNNKYLRLYAEFENYKRIVAKEKEDLIKYSNEELLKSILSVLDHLELALQHSDEKSKKSSSALIEGVELTLKELKDTLEKFGLVSIEALGKPFDPFFHHAMSQVETDESEENIVVTEFRKGYMLKERVLRPAFVGVSKRPPEEGETGEEKAENAEDTQ